MNDIASYSPQAPDRAEVDALPGLTLLQFGTDWCGHCQAAAPAVAAALQADPAVSALRHLLVEDGPGRPLGRSFRVKLWPTLILLRDGQEVDRLVRPTEAAAVAQWLADASAPA
ncbi:MAG: thioredoxin family protein [Burkholderiales bacterium]|nr:thioredoxin family protein [Burkholderiales bacterium]